ncbi:hypothetical protein GCM10010191_33940 [Actinomadura vinacea]|uniref:Tn3 transposase DDE domain-containing protein n=1 Tax=Actinomadura vinacea TaxID=115336 RepID=A0ABP5W732_9ACTN
MFWSHLNLYGRFELLMSRQFDLGQPADHCEAGALVDDVIGLEIAVRPPGGGAERKTDRLYSS